ncbi:hypothetical protein BDP27DRAFT_1418912 [Rhodocollybia butyracea]|uniref:C3H1-type domain-containing protein n=1 Tax=Rhodocollybia butyracea TaxID=206335 RepID=A0A9P5Q0V2_9AGAR|nr:hypothetical protein BDP27DRAFT_1418912 [Rhodocollybia butyracea]
MASSSSEAQLKHEIARLTASINMHKSTLSTRPATGYRSNSYVNPNYKPANKYLSTTSTTLAKEVVLNGVAFQSSGRSLVRKDRELFPLSSTRSKLLPVPKSSSAPPTPAAPPYNRKSGHLLAANRVYKPKSSRGRRGGLSNHNMTLTNGRRPYQSVWPLDLGMRFYLTSSRARRAHKRMKYSDKQCPRFSTTGSCSHGLTCAYQHDPSKIAICWNFLQDNCPNTADTCNLSHDPTPQRTPLCLHFLNKGRCTRPNCLYPHVNVGARQGICRDFAVLGYCDKGLDCDKQHVRECPDFAEKGTCTVKGCKLPHVIRANRNRKPASTSGTTSSPETTVPEGESRVQPVSADDAQLGDEYISLTFNESESEASDGEEDDEEEEEEEQEGDDPDDVDDILPVVG